MKLETPVIHILIPINTFFLFSDLQNRLYHFSMGNFWNKCDITSLVNSAMSAPKRIPVSRFQKSLDSVVGETHEPFGKVNKT